MTSLVTLEDFRKVLGYNPYHFWGLSDNDLLRPDSACNQVVYKYNWQNAQAVGREAVTEALEIAESKIRDYLGYSIAPRYFIETVDWPRFFDPSRVRITDVDPTGKYISQRLRYGWVQALGYEQLTLIGNANVTYSDTDSDGINDTFVVSIATAITDPDKIAVYFTSTDRLDNEPVSERWRINPVQVQISGGTVTVRGRSWMLVKPVLYEGVAVASTQLDPATATNFVTQLAIYNRTTNPDGETVDNAQATLIWETSPCHGWWCCCGCNATTSSSDSYLDPAAIYKAIARVGIRDAEDGTVTGLQAVRNAATGVWSQTPWGVWREPDKVQFRYYAGFPLEHIQETNGNSAPLMNGQVNRLWLTSVVRMAAAEMAQRICACDRSNAELYKWQFDLSRVSGANDESYATTAEIMGNPFGTRRGHVYAWQQVKNFRNMIGFATG